MTATAPSVKARPLQGPPRRLPFLRTYYWILVALLFLPIGLLFIFSFNDSHILALPLTGFTLAWYQRLFDTPALLRAAGASLAVAFASSLVATALGTMVALLISRFTFRFKGALIGLSVLPLIVPFVVLAVALLILFRAVGIELSLVTVGVAHAIVALPYTLLIVLTRLVGFERNVEDAAADLGATYPTTLRLVVLPIVAPAIVAAWLTAFTVSFDEFALANFLAGRQPTFPVYLFGQLRFTQSLPVLIAAAVLLMVGTILLVLLSERIRRIR
ncbi:MAG TPA: ABC transporter permease [Candidatus Dormibacteraeota bacterium]|nr:ABC transporter permease [Candidatus Dormibacteraeota bacterium]